MAKEELLGCPFCDGEAQLNNPFNNPSRGSWVSCTQCMASTAMRDTGIGAIKAWNKRHKLEQEIEK